MRKLWLLLILLAASTTPSRAQVPTPAIGASCNNVGQQSITNNGVSVTCTGTPGAATWQTTPTSPAPGTPIGSGVPSQQVTGGTLYNPSSTGNFSNTQSNFYFQSSLNSCNPTTVITKLNAIQSSYGTANWTDALTGCVHIPSGATNGQSIGVDGYAINDNSTVGAYNGSFGLGLNGSAYCRVGSSECEGAVGLALDDGSLSGVTLVGMETGLFPQNTGDVAYGYLFSPFSNVQPGTMIAFYLHTDSPYTTEATSGFECGTGSLTTAGTFYRRCMVLNPIAAGNKQYSQSVVFRITNSSGVVINSNLIAAPDSNGNPYLRYALDGSSNNSSPALLPDHAGTNGQSPASNLTFASCTMASGTCTYTFINAYTTAPFCSATWNGTGTLTGIVKAVPGTSSVIVTSSVNTDTGVMDIVCGPQAN